MNKTNHYPLQFAQYYPEIVSKLEVLPRTGWVQWNIENPETVWEHTLATRELAITYKNHLQLSDDEFHDLLTMIEIHDWPEAVVGDGVILGDEEDIDTLRKNKQERELEAMKEICEDTIHGDEILKLFQRFEASTDPVAAIAIQIDKLQAVLKAAEYEKAQHKQGLADEFFHYTKKAIHHPYLISELTHKTAHLM